MKRIPLLSFRARSRNLLLFLTTSVFAAVGLCFGGEKEDFRTTESPDKNWMVAVRSVPDPDAIWRQDLDGFRLVIVPVEKDGTRGKTFFARNFPLKIVREIAWTTDSKFVVFTTASSGGHQPWHSQAYAFSVDRRAIKSIDDAIGPVLREAFELQTPHVAVMQIPRPKGDGFDYEHPTSRSLDLERLFGSANRK